MKKNLSNERNYIIRSRAFISTHKLIIKFTEVYIIMENNTSCKSFYNSIIMFTTQRYNVYSDYYQATIFCSFCHRKKELAINNSINLAADRVKCKFGKVGEESAAYESKKVLEDL
jgi:hypothetical protein